MRLLVARNAAPTIAIMAEHGLLTQVLPFAPITGRLSAYVGIEEQIAAGRANPAMRVGRTRKALEEAGVADNTIFIFTTDNGTSSGAQIHNAGMRGRKGSPYDGGHRVPFFVRWPGHVVAGVLLEARTVDDGVGVGQAEGAAQLGDGGAQQHQGPRPLRSDDDGRRINHRDDMPDIDVCSDLLRQLVVQYAVSSRADLDRCPPY